MKHLCLALAAAGALGLAPLGHAAESAENDLPETLRSNYEGPIVGPVDDRVYAHGELGLIRPSYGRASLYVAWRAMHFPPGALANESHERIGNWVSGGNFPEAQGGDALQAWKAAREEVQPKAPAVAPDYYRNNRSKGPVEFEFVEGQCGPGAYALATRTLGELVADKALKPADRQAWVAGQDAVFARCSWVPGTKPLPLPAALPVNAPARLRALNAYQRAAALFYGDEFLPARQAFDAIAATPGHPMRAWAALGALRSVVRDAARDAEWDAAVADAWTQRGLRDAPFKAAVAEPAARSRARIDAALNEIDKRSKAALADATLAPVHPAIKYTVRRALLQLHPIVPLRAAMDALDRLEVSPYAYGTLDLFQQLYPRFAPDRPQGEMAAEFRKHEWFDFIVTVQACADPYKPTDAAACDAEHGHALERARESRGTAWLLAALMTARRPSEADVPPAQAALKVSTDRPEWASLQFYAARVLRAQGRAAEARAALQALVAATPLEIRDIELLETEQPGVTTRPATLPITEAKMRAEYNRFAGLGRKEYQVRHILVPTREQAQAALDRIRGGEAFEAVAKVLSKDTGSAAKGGDLGWTLPIHFTPLFGDAVKRLAPRGIVDAPVQTPFGWHVIEVTEVRPRVLPPYEKVKARIREVMQRQAEQAKGQ